MPTTTDKAAEIRAEFKRLGWNSRAVSVRSDYFSMGSAIRVEVKSPSLPITVAERIARGAEEIARDEATGEILSGGNRYVDVLHSREVQEILGLRHVEALEAALARIPDGDRSRLEPIKGAPWAKVQREDRSRAILWLEQPDGRTVHRQFYPEGEPALLDAAYSIARWGPQLPPPARAGPQLARLRVLPSRTGTPNRGAPGPRPHPGAPRLRHLLERTIGEVGRIPDGSLAPHLFEWGAFVGSSSRISRGRGRAASSSNRPTDASLPRLGATCGLSEAGSGTRTGGGAADAGKLR